MQTWHEIAEAKNLKSGDMAHGSAGGVDVLVVNDGGALRAFVNRCGHMNAPLDLGSFKSGVIKCPMHNAVFDARTGVVRGQPIMAAPPGMDKLPPEILEMFAKNAPIFARIGCTPLTPLPVESADGVVRVFV